MWETVISISNLTKIYQLPRKGRRTAVNSLSLEIRRGEIFGFLGPNGAGKTTTIKTLLGFIQPTSGRAEILGVSVEDPNSRIRVGYLPEQPYFYKFMTPTEIVSMHAALVGVPKRERKEHVEQLLSAVGMKDLARTPISKMSKGQVQRVGLAQALVGNPEILILDEPASGLDPLGRRHVRDLLQHQREEGKTIFLSSHLLSEIETVCDRVAVLSHGKLTAIGRPDEIKQGGGWSKVVTGSLSAELLERIYQLDGQTKCSEGETTISIDSNKIYELIDTLREANLPLISVSQERESLEEAFLRLAA
jgi:ABC-2 type transport system ATP-binding protein